MEDNKKENKVPEDVSDSSNSKTNIGDMSRNKEERVEKKNVSFFDINLIEICLELVEDIRNGTILNNVKNGNINYVMAGVSILTVIAVFFPAAEISAMGYVEKFSTFDISVTYAIVALLVGLLSLLAVLSGKSRIAVLSGGAYTLMGVIYWMQVNSAISNTYGFGKMGIGIYLMIISGIAVVITNYLDYKKGGNTIAMSLIRAKKIQKRIEEMDDSAISAINELICSEDCPESLKEAGIKMKSESRTIKDTQNFIEEIKKCNEFIPAQQRAIVEEYALLLSEYFEIAKNLYEKRNG